MDPLALMMIFAGILSMLADVIPMPYKSVPSAIMNPNASSSILAALGCCACALQDAGLLPHIREKMAEILVRQPNYTCTETIERTRQSSGSHSKIEDTLRLEVALVDGKEMFAWPGSKQFEDHDLSDLVSTGMFGNGNFAIYARILFLSNAATFQDRGETQLDGRPRLALRFSSIALAQRSPFAGEQS